MEQGRVIRPWIGVSGKLISRELGKILNLSLVDGFLVETVEPWSPAQRAGVQGGALPITIAGEEFLFGGDIITHLDGQQLGDPESFAQLVRSLKVGDKVTLSLYGEGKKRKVELMLVERPILPGDLRSGGQGMLSPLHSRSITRSKSD